MAYVAKGMKSIWDNPIAGAAELMRVGPGLQLSGTGKMVMTDNESSTVAWIEVFLPDDKTTGWINALEFKAVEDSQPPPFDQEFFVRSCLSVERQLNGDPSIAPWFVAADFLIARALFETAMASGGQDITKPIGPMAMKPAEWDDFLSSDLIVAKEFGSADRRLQLAQVFACGQTMSKSAEAFSTAVTPVGGDGDVPSYLDVFLSYLLDVPTAAKLGDPTSGPQPIQSLGVTSDQVTRLKVKPGLSAVRSTMSASDFVAAVSQCLGKLLDTAFARMQTLAPDELPQPTSAVPAWLTIARAELARGVSETANSDRLVTYFDSIGMKVTSPVPYWCGAFVGFCVKTSGGLLPSGPARAANWKTWGNQTVPVGASQIPVGAVVVLKPQTADTSGHVGFFESFKDSGTIELLGGNQGDAVSKKGFALNQVAAIRMFAPEIPIGAGDSFDMTKAGVRLEFQRYGDLIVDRFKRAGFTTKYHLAAALANAIKESHLDPEAASPLPEHSYGLFQCNQKNGVGKGYSKEQLFDPDLNTALIIAEARRASAFVSASTLEAAVDAFVRYIERPKNKEGAISSRLEVARQLLSTG